MELVSGALVQCAVILALTLAASAMIIWPVCSLEGWRGDLPITALLASAFILLSTSCHYFDRVDERKRQGLRKSS